MRISLIYTHVIGRSDETAPPPEYYLPYAERFVDTYKKFDPGIEHTLDVVCCGGGVDIAAIDLFPDGASFCTYFGGGWDIGAHQFAAKMMTADWVVCCSTPVYFKRAGWLARLAEAWTQYGDGLYGPNASFEHHPHLRTSCYAFKPERMREYPHLIDTREKTRKFESMGWNFSEWFIRKNLPVKLVTWGGCCDQVDWRTPPNIFRRGDQSNCLVFDRHHDLYERADPETQRLNNVRL